MVVETTVEFWSLCRGYILTSFETHINYIGVTYVEGYIGTLVSRHRAAHYVQPIRAKLGLSKKEKNAQTWTKIMLKQNHLIFWDQLPHQYSEYFRLLMVGNSTKWNNGKLWNMTIQPHKMGAFHSIPLPRIILTSDRCNRLTYR